MIQGNVASLFAAAVLAALPAYAQTGPAGTLRVTVVDPSNAVVIGATVGVTGAEPATSAVKVEPVKSGEGGVAAIPNLPPGRYTVQAEFPGFETRTLPDVRIRPGENRQVAVLQISRLEQTVSVGRDKQEAAADPRMSFGTTLTREQIEQLSDDPQTLQQQLQEMAGPGAVIRVDGFDGSPLPAKAQIRSIRISRDQFAAEFHTAGGVSIEIITQPGLGPIRYNMNTRMRGGGLSARSPFVPVKGPEGNVGYGFGLGGALIKDKSSFNVNVFGQDAYDTPNVNVALPGGGIQSEALNLRKPSENVFVNGQMDYALTVDQTLRFGYNLTRFYNENLGVGGYDQRERAFTSENMQHNFRVQHYGPIGRRMFSRSRLQVFAADTETRSVSDAPTVRVNDAFTSGGAQVTGGDHARRLNVGSDLDYVRGRNSWRAGMALDAAWTRSDSQSNYLGTYTFDNLDAFNAGRPSNYTRRIGDPNLSYRMFQAAFYLQDDFRPVKNLTLSAGVRYEVQTHVKDRLNLGPRAGFTWAPFKNGRTTLRGSAGIFYDWLANGIYEQALRIDGLRQQELNILNPSFPDPGSVGLIPPINRYLLGDEYRMPRTTRFSGGVDQQIGTARVSGTYSYQRGARLARGLNLNAPVDGVRPDPAFRNIVEVVSDASSWQHQLQVDGSLNPGALLPAFKGPLVSWKRTTVFVNYTLARLENNSDGPFAIPATGSLALERGPAGNDIRQRVNLAFNNQVIRNVLMGVNLNAASADPYALLTGRDDNGDGVFNDRPAGSVRNSLRARGQVTMNAFLGYQFAFGRSAPQPPGVGVFGGGNSAQVRTFDVGAARYRLGIFMNMFNLLNRANYLGYSGTMTSPFFGRATTVRDMRKIDFGLNLQF
ncbi:MAG TPA: TonB-dependent receptor [Vicinamibacterales bacterium]|nr:TonB-dependent receptor [Vicinamibacterales bacterium]